MSEENQNFQLEISDETAEKLTAYAQKTNRNENEAIEYIIKEYLQNQLDAIKKCCKETQEPIANVFSRQFAKLVETLLGQENKSK